MAIPVYLQQFKAAGIYRLVFDKSTMLNVNTEIMRLVVGYSEQGPFNIPTYVTNVATFKALYGDVSKKLEKRGVWFHRLAQQALASGPILALNLKKFDGEAVGAATIDTTFNSKFDSIDEEKLFVEDIYDTTRFWEISSEKLNDLRTVDGSKMDKYINISAIDTAKNSATYFIRKASGSVVNGYKVTLNDWYADGQEVMPEYLEDAKSTLVSDYMAEIYVFKGKFTKEQVLASNSLKQHFTTDENGELVLRKYELDAFGDAIDPLEALYNDENSGALGHYVGTLIPNMKNKQGQYISLDIAFNEDYNIHSMMMAFNTDMLDEEITPDLQISGKNNITDNLLNGICNGTAFASVLGNRGAEIYAQTVKYSNNVTDKLSKSILFKAADKYISGTLFVSKVLDSAYQVELSNIDADGSTSANKVILQCANDVELEGMLSTLKKLNVLGADKTTCKWDAIDPALWNGKTIITSIKRIKKDGNAYRIDGNAMKVATANINLTLTSEVTSGHDGHNHIHNASLTFTKVNDSWTKVTTITEGGEKLKNKLICYNGDNSLTSVLSEGDAVVAAPYVSGRGEDGTDPHKQAFVTSIVSIPAEEKQYFKLINKTQVEGIETTTGEYIDVLEYEKLSDEDKAKYAASNATIITFTEEPLFHADDLAEFDKSHNELDGDSTEVFIIRIDGDLCQEIGTIKPHYLEGYTYGVNAAGEEMPGHAKPAGTDMLSKLNWQNFIMSALTDYKGVRTGLLNKSDVDYRYIVDTFESYVDGGVKKVLSFLAKEKQSAFAILNFPAVKTFVKCPYSSYVDDKGVFNVKYVVDGYNKKKAHSKGFSLPSDDEGASFCAFYTPLKFSDGYVDTIVPSAGIVSNLFLKKYLSRQPYYIIAGPNYGAITASGLVGPDYNYSQEELHIIEPYGVNCMVYRPAFGTFINANQTAKQTPLSALSRVNVRELVIYLQDEIEKVLQNYQWEFNNAITRNAILDKANTICANIQANGGIQAYKNIMDESNNTPEIIDNEMAIISTHIEPGFGCGKMVQELTIYKTGGLSASISD